jgi:cytochrome b involved in lipid metabolism
MLKYFTKKEVALHNTTEDAWLIVSGKIYNLSSVISKYGPDVEELKPLVMFAGKDVSHWFEKDTDNVKNFPPIPGKSSSNYVNCSVC